MFMSVDLPEPDWPTMARNSPLLTEMWTSRRARTLESPRSYVFSMCESSMSAMRSPWGRPLARRLATAALRALGAPGARLRFLHLDGIAVLQLAGEGAVRSLDHLLALVDAVEDLDVGAAGDAGMHFPHLRLAVLHHEDDLHRLRLTGRRRGGRLVAVGAGRRRGGLVPGHE